MQFRITKHTRCAKFRQRLVCRVRQILKNASIFHAKTKQEMFLPKDIPVNHSFRNSVFQNSECETILRNIVLLQRKTNPEAWSPFSWEDYKAFCTHRVTESERTVLDVFVNGGKASWNTSTYQQPDWLHFDGEWYSLTGKMIEMLGRDYPSSLSL